jgi:hypothetical protein
MSYLQLAENDPYSHLAQDIPVSAREMYVYIPQGYRGASKDMYIREDLLDTMPQSAYNKLMYELEPYQNTGLSAGRGAERRADRKAKRDARKDARMEARDVRSQRRADIFGKLTDTAGNLVKGIFGGSETDATAGATRTPEGFNLDVSVGQEQSFLSKYKVPLIIGGVAVGGFLLYKTMNKKKR